MMPTLTPAPTWPARCHESTLVRTIASAPYVPAAPVSVGSAAGTFSAGAPTSTGRRTCTMSARLSSSRIRLAGMSARAREPTTPMTRPDTARTASAGSTPSSAITSTLIRSSTTRATSLSTCRPSSTRAVTSAMRGSERPPGSLSSGGGPACWRGSGSLPGIPGTEAPVPAPGPVPCTTPEPPRTTASPGGREPSAAPATATAITSRRTTTTMAPPGAVPLQRAAAANVGRGRFTRRRRPEPYRALGMTPAGGIRGPDAHGTLSLTTDPEVA